MRKTIIPRKRKLLFIRFQASEEAIDAVAKSSWARNLAESQARTLGFVPGSTEFNEAVNRGARTLAMRFLRSGDQLEEEVVAKATTKKKQ